MKINKPEVIRVDIPANKILELLKKFATSEGLDITKHEKHDERVTLIQTTKKINSYFKTWWQARPQIVDWNIIDLEGKGTQIEMFFRLHRKFRVWFWTVILTLSALLAVSMQLDSGILVHLTSIKEPFRRLVFSLTEASVIALAFLVFMGRCIQNNYNTFLRSFRRIRQEYHGDHLEALIKEYQFGPLGPEILVFSFLGVSVLLVAKTPLNLSWFVAIAAFVGLICLLLFLVGMFIIGLSSDQFRIRLNLGPLGVLLIFALLFFYAGLYMPSATYKEQLYSLSQEYLTVFTQVKISENNFLPSVEFKAYFFITLLFQIVTMFIGVLLVSTLAKAAVEMKQWRTAFFSTQGWGPTQDRVAAVRKIPRVFIVTIFVLWIGLAGGFLLLLYFALSVVEFSVFLDNFLFPTSISWTFCTTAMAITTWLCYPTIKAPVAVIIARILIVLYCFPLVWMTFMVLKKRTGTYLTNLKQIRASKQRTKGKYASLSDVLGEISLELGMRKPEIVLVPSKVPAVMAKYIGFPYFQSFLWITDGCLKLTTEELGGLLAHEMWHMKRHSLRWHILCLLSDYTLFGTGFLAMTVNTYQQELDADSYAARFVKKRGTVADFIIALRMVAAAGGQPKSIQGLGLAVSEMSVTREAEEGRSFVRKLKTDIGLLFELYFGDEILSYIYPPLEKRIERIKAIGLEESDDLR